MKRILSLGAGVQSSTLALMIARGELPPIDAAIFADTGWEPPKVYLWLDWLEKQLPFPVHRVQRGNLRQDVLTRSNTTSRVAAIPWHMVMPNGDRAMGRRQCTKEYKLEPITKKTRELVGLVPRQRAKGVLCEMLIGISTDEALRMKPSHEKWKLHRC
jgi:3'-phosphoadenosine 5'-phosphosulfate sulfotransferase (PAPS reductase)/FAD synthetase